MRTLGNLLALLLAGVATAFAHLPAGKLVDLTHPFDAQTIFWPTEDGFVLHKQFDGVTDKGYYYSANRFCTAEHGGTHVDAPVHFRRGGRTVDALPLEQLIGAAVVIDVSARARVKPDYQVRSNDFLDWEQAHGRIPDGAIVLLRTGFGKFWPYRASYMGTEEHGHEAVAKLHFPGLHPAAAKWLVRERAIKAVGLDTPSIDYGQSATFDTHQILFAADIPAFENVAHVSAVPAIGAFVIALPMLIRGGSGGPLRIVAVLPEGAVPR